MQRNYGANPGDHHTTVCQNLLCIDKMSHFPQYGHNFKSTQVGHCDIVKGMASMQIFLILCDENFVQNISDKYLKITIRKRNALVCACKLSTDQLLTEVYRMQVKISIKISKNHKHPEISIWNTVKGIPGRFSE